MLPSIENIDHHLDTNLDSMLNRESNDQKITLFQNSYSNKPKFLTDKNSPRSGNYRTDRNKSPSKILGDYHMQIVNKAFADF